MIPYDHLSLDIISMGGWLSAVPPGTVVTTYDLLNGPSYANPRYAPGVAPARPSALAGQSPFAEVEDAITVDVLGATAQQCMANAQALLGVLDQAAEWARGENVQPVQVRARAQGSALIPQAAIILGPAAGTPAAAIRIEYDVPAGLAAACWIARDVEIRFLRRPRWIVPSTLPQLGYSSYAAVGNVLTASGGTLVAGTTPIPTVIGLEGQTIGTDYLSDPTVLIAEGTARIAALAAGTSGMAGTSGFTSVASGSAASFGANLLRCTASGTGEQQSNIVATTLGGTTQLIGGAITLRNNSSASTWQIRVIVRVGIGVVSTSTSISTPIIVDGSSTAPQTVIIPPVPHRSITTDSNVIQVGVAIARLAGSGSTTIDIDEIALIALDTPGAAVLRIDATSAVDDLAIAPAERPERVGLAGIDLRGDAAAVVASFDSAATLVTPLWRGDAAISTTAASVQALVLDHDGDWRPLPGGNPSVFRLAISRRAAALVVQ